MPPGTDMDRTDIPELAAPRRVFKRRRNKGLITVLKIALPLIAVACVVYIVKWSREAPVVIPTEVLKQDGDAPQKAAEVTVNQVQYNGVDAQNRPYSITAKSASQPQKPEGATSDASEGGESVVNLEKLVADMTMSDGTWVALTADSGVFRRDAGTVDLSGNVTMFHDTGLSFETDAATVDLKNDWARGNQPVEGQNADGQLAAQGFEVKDNGQTIVFTGRSYLKLYPKQGGGS